MQPRRSPVLQGVRTGLLHLPGKAKADIHASNEFRFVPEGDIGRLAQVIWAPASKARPSSFFKTSSARATRSPPSEPEAFLFYCGCRRASGCFLEEDCGFERQKAGGVFKFMNEQRSVIVHRKRTPDVELVGYMFRSASGSELYRFGDLRHPGWRH
jgi:hypothetical protein